MWVILVIIMSLTTKITMSNQIPLLLWRSPRYLLVPSFPITHALFLCFYSLLHCPKSQIISQAKSISKTASKNIILLRLAAVWILNCTECWSASWWASSPSPSSGGGPAENVLDEVLYYDLGYDTSLSLPSTANFWSFVINGHQCCHGR